MCIIHLRLDLVCSLLSHHPLIQTGRVLILVVQGSQMPPHKVTQVWPGLGLWGLLQTQCAPTSSPRGCSVNLLAHESDDLCIFRAYLWNTLHHFQPSQISTGFSFLWTDGIYGIHTTLCEAAKLSCVHLILNNKIFIDKDIPILCPCFRYHLEYQISITGPDFSSELWIQLPKWTLCTDVL